MNCFCNELVVASSSLHCNLNCKQQTIVYAVFTCIHLQVNNHKRLTPHMFLLLFKQCAFETFTIAVFFFFRSTNEFVWLVPHMCFALQSKQQIQITMCILRQNSSNFNVSNFEMEITRSYMIRQNPFHMQFYNVHSTDSSHKFI